MRRFRSAAAAVTLSALTVGAAATGATASTSSSHYALTTSTDAYRGLNRTHVVRWAPCITRSGRTTTHVIGYRVNPGGVGSRVDLTKRAIAKLSGVSGLQFRYLGRTSFVPRYARLHYPSGDQLIFEAAQQRRATGAQLVVAWAPRGEQARASNILTSTEAGVGTVSWRSGYDSQMRILDGAVVIKRSTRMKSGFQAGGSIGTLLLHELGHAMGLRHVSDTSQVMYPVIGSRSPAGYQAGDRNGLAHVGRPAGCMTTPGLPAVDPVQIARAAGVSVTL